MVIHELALTDNKQNFIQRPSHRGAEGLSPPPSVRIPAPALSPLNEMTLCTGVYGESYHFESRSAPQSPLLPPHFEKSGYAPDSITYQLKVAVKKESFLCLHVACTSSQDWCCSYHNLLNNQTAISVSHEGSIHVHHSAKNEFSLGRRHNALCYLKLQLKHYSSVSQWPLL